MILIIYMTYISFIFWLEFTISTNRGDERRNIDQCMTKLRTLVQELDICLIIASHLRRTQDGSHDTSVVLTTVGAGHSVTITVDD